MKSVFTTFLMIILGVCVYGQHNIIPPLPQSRIFEKYINHETEEYNGLPKINIPLFEIELKGMKIPVILSYHASGIKYKQYDGEVGAGWTLNIGGFRIMRTVFGKADEKYPLYDEQQFNQMGSTDFYRAMAYLGNIYFTDYLSDEASSILNGYSYPKEDSGYDLFTFNLPTTTGHFIISDRQTKNVDIIENSHEKIILDPGKEDLSLNDVKLIDDKGNIYIMDGKTNNIEFSDFENKTAWTLTQMQTISGDTVDFSYVKKYKAEQTGFNPGDVIIKEAATLLSSGSMSFEDYADFDILFDSSFDQYYESLLSGISTQNMILHIDRSGLTSNMINRIEVYSKPENRLIKTIYFQYYIEGGAEGHYLLSNIAISGSSSSDRMVYNFDYYGAPEDPCPDMWGYYTSAKKSGETYYDHIDNDIFLHKVSQNSRIKYASNSGITKPINEMTFGNYKWWVERINNKNIPNWYSLKQITYPTGGYSIYRYEPHQYRQADGTLMQGGDIRIAEICTEGDELYPSGVDFFYGDGIPNLDLNINSFRKEKLHFTIERETEGFEDISRVNRHIHFLVNPNYADASNFMVRYNYIKRIEKRNYDTDVYGHWVESYYDIPENFSMSEVEHHCMPSNDEISFYNNNAQVSIYRPGYKPLLIKRMHRDDDRGKIVKTEHYTYENSSSRQYYGVKIFQSAFFNNYFEQADSYLFNSSNCVSSYFDYLKYKIITGSQRLKTKLIQGEIEEQNETYVYDTNNQLVQVKSLISQTPQQITKTTNYTYSRNNPEMMIRNMVSDVIEAITYYNGKEVERTKINYQLFSPYDIIRPYSIQKYLRGITTPDTTETFEQFDKFGNPVSVITTDGINTIYLWSYGGQYPIAEIKNASYSDVTTVVEAIFGVTDIDDLSDNEYIDENQDTMIAKFNELRKHSLLKNALITSYTYIPLIGMSSITDPSGRTIYYAYDNFGRLEESYFKENDRKKIIEAYEYNYKK